MDASLAELREALGLQLLFSLFLGALFWSLYVRVHRQAFFAWWAAAWFAYGLFAAAGAAAIGLAFPSPSISPVESDAIQLVAVVAGFLHPVLLVLGVQRFRVPGPDRARGGRVALLAATALGLLVYDAVEASAGNAVLQAAGLNALRLLAAGVAYLYCASVLARRAGGSRAALATAAICGLWGLEQIVYAFGPMGDIAVLVLHRQVAPLDLRRAMGVHWATLDLFWELAIAFAMVRLLLEDFRRTTEQLERAVELNRALVEASPLAIMAVDRGGEVRTWNRAAERLFGWSADEVIGHPLPNLPDDQRDPAEALTRRTDGGETVIGADMMLARRDGSFMPARVSAAPILDAGGGSAGVMRVVEDTTDVRRLEAQLLHAQRLEAVGRLAGGIAHDFNNLLTAVVGATEFLRVLIRPGSPGREEIDEIGRAAERATDLTRQLLAYSRRQVLQPRVLALDDVVRGMDRFLHRIIGEDVQLSIQPGGDIGYVFADPGQLEQVITNLAVNARDAMPRGGELRIETARLVLTSPRSDGWTDVPPGDWVVLRVIDSGVGMSQEVQAQLFEPFFTTKEVGRGTGLGLATVYGIVHQSGGHILVTSAPGQGATFEVLLPRTLDDADVAAPLQEPAPGPAPGPAAAGSGTVLVAEDEPQVRQLVRRILESYGYTVLVASSGVEAAQVARAHADIDLLLTDVVMPGISGVELARQLRQTHPTMRALLMSGYPNEALSAYGVLDPGDMALITKPFAPALLARRIEELLYPDRPTA
jgi:PAS domain S-box-containing protein